MTKHQLTYGEAIDELEEILSKIEQGEPDVDELTRNVKRAAYLLRYCRTKLHKASSEVEEILKSLDEDQIREDGE
jgi:exodeoxyribonuclease VII small subunit